MKKLLLTAFEPFGGQLINPSLEAAREMGKRPFPGTQIQVLELPVHRFDAIETTLTQIRSYQPDVVLMLGEAGGRAEMTPERIAVNLDDFPIPDHGGHQPRGELIAPNGPQHYLSSLPLEAIRKRLIQAQIPASISDSAGNYLCNRLFYSVMHTLALGGGRRIAGFVHLPYLEEQVAHLAHEVPCLSRNQLMDGVQLVIEVCLER